MQSRQSHSSASSVTPPHVHGFVSVARDGCVSSTRVTDENADGFINFSATVFRDAGGNNVQQQGAATADRLTARSGDGREDAADDRDGLERRSAHDTLAGAQAGGQVGGPSNSRRVSTGLTSHHYPPQPGATRSLAFPSLYVDGDHRAMLDQDIHLTRRMRAKSEDNLADALLELQSLTGAARARERMNVVACVADLRRTRMFHDGAWLRLSSFRVARINGQVAA